ncbi:hypothetical protein M2347_004007 [Chryseobacterium sp. H1D6B]|uniref:hypothetical protein n=1 Tax=Chryseobacterium sp. H1D6B TaxID=2940588 RepID=UPI0015C90E89|nr:hypothetical protein [Chryseobacterium sp. H1D6B]MDH6254280.1 hypothetical protein [Chryseobacterium sp. H1D6B]
MKNYFFFIFLLFIIVSCGGDSNDEIVNPSSSSEQKITLNDVTIVNDNTIKLQWSATSKNTYVSFYILRKYAQIGQYKKIYEVSGSTSEKTDQNLNYTPYTEYQIIGYLNNGDMVKSNPVIYNRPEIKLLNISPIDALFDADNGSAFIFGENGNIIKYDVNSGQKVKEISTGVALGYSYLGTYNGQKELYVPRKDGWVYIYNPDDLTFKDKINFGSSVTNVILAGGKLYGSIDSPPSDAFLKCFDRGTKSLISNYNIGYNGRLKLIPNTNASFYYLTTNLFPEKLKIFNYDSNGTFISQNQLNSSAQQSLNYKIFEALPSGNGLLVSMQGGIYDSNLTYKGDLPRGDSNLSGFDFDSNYVIAGANNNRKIEFYKLTDYSKINSLSTKGYPFKVFNYGNKVVSISSTNILSMASAFSGPGPEDIAIEVLNK